MLGAERQSESDLYSKRVGGQDDGARLSEIPRLVAFNSELLVYDGWPFSHIYDQCLSAIPAIAKEEE